MNSSAPHEITFRPVEEQDFPILAAWLAEPHVRRFYQKTSGHAGGNRLKSTDRASEGRSQPFAISRSARAIRSPTCSATAMPTIRSGWT